MKNVLAALLKTMVTVALFYLLFRKVDFHEFWATLRTARFNLLLLGFAVLEFLALVVQPADQILAAYLAISLSPLPWLLLSLAAVDAPADARSFPGAALEDLLHRTVLQPRVPDGGGRGCCQDVLCRQALQAIRAEFRSDVPRPRRGDAGHDDHRLLCHACAPREHSRGPGLAHRMGGIRGLPAR